MEVPAGTAPCAGEVDDDTLASGQRIGEGHGDTVDVLSGERCSNVIPSFGNGSGGLGGQSLTRLSAELRKSSGASQQCERNK